MRHRAASAAFIIAVTLLAGIAACGRPTGPADALYMARTRWARLGPADYTYTIHRSCECLPEMSGPTVVTVRHGTVTSRSYVNSGAAVGSTYAAQVPTVEGLFEIIERGIQDGVRPLSARYDAELGYPTRFSIGDPATDAPLYTVSDFRPE